MRHRHRLNATHMVYRRLSPLRHDRAEGRGGSVLDKALDASRRKLPIRLNDMGAHRRLRCFRLCEQVFVPSWARSGLDWDVRQGRGSPRGTGMIIEFHLTGV